MVFVLSSIAIFVLISVYFFFRAEELQRKVLKMKRETSAVKKENQAYVEAMAIISQRYEDIYKKRFNDQRLAQGDNHDLLEMISPMINNYSVILNESLHGQGKLHKVVKQTYEGGEKGSYKKLTNYIAQQESEVRQAWSSNTFHGYISMVEALLAIKSK